MHSLVMLFISLFSCQEVMLPALEGLDVRKGVYTDVLIKIFKFSLLQIPENFHPMSVFMKDKSSRIHINEKRELNGETGVFCYQHSSHVP